MTITAKIIADSISEAGKRITSLQLRYPRFIHAEFMTHRVFSRNASSSRAIPIERLIKDIIDDTAMPIHWGKNQPGMQADEECDAEIKLNVFPPSSYGYDSPWKTVNKEEAWFKARDNAIEIAKAFNEAGYHKQIVNRLLEPFSHINVIVTATEWDNFFALRCHKDAQPEIRELATKMRVEMGISTPQLLKPGEWHLPYVTQEDRQSVLRDCNRDVIRSYSKNEKLVFEDVLLRCSVARCARVSYLTYEMKKPEIEADLKLYDRLVGSVPLHASPAEHQATPAVPEFEIKKHWGNFEGWRQYRKMIEL